MYILSSEHKPICFLCYMCTY